MIKGAAERTLSDPNASEADKARATHLIEQATQIIKADTWADGSVASAALHMVAGLTNGEAAQGAAGAVTGEVLGSKVNTGNELLDQLLTGIAAQTSGGGSTAAAISSVLA